MTNLYREIQQTAEQYGLSMEELIHALTATIYGNCCPRCGENMQSEAFLKAFDQMSQDFAFCRDFSTRPAA